MFKLCFYLTFLTISVLLAVNVSANPQPVNDGGIDIIVNNRGFRSAVRTPQILGRRSGSGLKKASRPMMKGKSDF